MYELLYCTALVVLVYKFLLYIVLVNAQFHVFSLLLLVCINYRNKLINKIQKVKINCDAVKLIFKYSNAHLM